jgi:iron complex outermembrane receptor protein
MSDDATTKRAALLYKFDNGIAPYIQYTESFQPTVGTDLAGNPFKPTTGKQEEAGIEAWRQEKFFREERPRVEKRSFIAATP